MKQQNLIQTWLAVLVLPLLSSVANAALLPECQTTAPRETNLTQVRTAEVAVPFRPFGLGYATHGHHAFVALEAATAKNDSTLGILDTSTFPPTLVRQISLPEQDVGTNEALGVAVSKDGKHVFVAAGEGAFIVDASRAIKGKADPVVGYLTGRLGNTTTGEGAIEVTVSHDQKYVFVSQEYGSNPGNTPGNIDVFKLGKREHNGTIPSQHIGHLDLDYAVVGSVQSPDGRFLYAVSETTTANDSTYGILSVIDVPTLKTTPSEALRFSVSAACGPVRVIVSKNGKTVWVTARESNHVLAFNATKLAANMSDAMIASVQVGTAPVGMTFARDESLILTANSNRFGNPNATTGISVIDVKAVLNGSSTTSIGQFSTGMFPREFAVSPDGKTVLVSDYSSNQVQAIDVSTLPHT